MVADAIFAGADRAPARAALIYNGRVLNYGDFARSIAGAQRFLRARGAPGEGVAILALDDLREFWVLSLALRRLGLTTMSVPSVADLVAVDLPDVRCVIASPSECWPGLEAACAARAWPLIMASGDDPPSGHGR